MPEFTVRNIAFTALMAAATAAILAAVVLLARQNDNAPIQIIAPDSQQQPASEVRVFVNGAVVNPGVYILAPDSRITDALAAAGGNKTAEANLEGVNLALRVLDEAEIYIPAVGESPTPPAASQSGQTGGQSEPGGLIDLNLASAELLDTLPGIGPALAEAIIAYRESVRPFQSVEEVQEVFRIGPVIYQNIRDLVTVSGTR